MATNDELEHREKVGQLEADLRGTQKEVHEIKAMLGKMFDKFDEFVKQQTPKQMGLGAVMSMVAAGLGSLAIVFGCIIYIVNSTNAPTTAALSQVTASLQSINTVVLQTANAVQLANKEITVVSNRAAANEQTSQWILFDENLPKQLTQHEKDIERLRDELYQLKQRNLK